MEKLKIAITQGNYNGTACELILRACEDPAMLEICTPVVYGSATAALAFRKALELSTNFTTIKHPDEAYDGRLNLINAADATVPVEFGVTNADALQQEEASLQAAAKDLEEGLVDALVMAPATKATPCPADATEVIIVGQAHIMPLAGEPTADDVMRFHDILERDFDLRAPRIAILQESRMQNNELAQQVTTEHGINTYGPYTAEQFFSSEAVCHFDGIITTEGPNAAEALLSRLSQDAPVRFFANREGVATAAYQPARMHDAAKGIAELTILTQPIYAAIDIVRCRASYDEARRNPLPKLFRDRREDYRQSREASQNRETPQSKDSFDNAEESE